MGIIWLGRWGGIFMGVGRGERGVRRMGGFGVGGGSLVRGSCRSSSWVKWKLLPGMLDRVPKPGRFRR